MVEWKLSRMSSVWERNVRRGGPGPIGAGGVVCTGNSIATALADFTQAKQPWEIRGGETEIYQTSTWKLRQQRVRRGRRGEGVRFDRENVHHP